MAETENTAAAPAKGGNKMMLVVILAVVLVLAGMAVVMFKMKGAATGAKGEEKTPGVELAIGEFTVNLADQDQIRYMKADIVLEVDEAAAKAYKGDDKGEEATVPAPIRDAVIEVLSSQMFNELLKPEGRTKLKEELMEAVEKRLKDGKVIDAYFNEFAMQ